MGVQDVRKRIYQKGGTRMNIIDKLTVEEFKEMLGKQFSELTDEQRDTAIELAKKRLQVDWESEIDVFVKAYEDIIQGYKDWHVCIVDTNNGKRIGVTNEVDVGEVQNSFVSENEAYKFADYFSNKSGIQVYNNNYDELV